MNTLPKLYKIKQNFDSQPTLNELHKEVLSELDYILDNSNKQLSKGSKIAITAGSRGITNIKEILQDVVNRLNDLGYHPFIFSAMGSHGGGTGEGQKEILKSLGIDSISLKCDISASAEVIQIDEVEIDGQNLPVYIAKEAYESDGIIIINRIKPHTSFTGDHESGMYKMMAVGMGRKQGAESVHRLGAAQIPAAIQLIADKILRRASILGGIGIVENANERTALIKGALPEDISSVDQSLLKLAKTYMPRLPFSDVDLLIVKEMGKNFSGTGMDTNIIGRIRIEGVKEPDYLKVRYLAVLDLSEASHGNATGIGLADFTTKRLVRKIDKKSTYLNCLTSGFVTRAAVPMTFSNDEEVIEGAALALKLENKQALKLAIIKNTLHIDEVWVSENLLDTLQGDIEIVKEPLTIHFLNDALVLKKGGES